MFSIIIFFHFLKNSTQKNRFLIYKIDFCFENTKEDTLRVLNDGRRRRPRKEGGGEAASDERRRAQPGERESGKVTVERRPGRRAECGAFFVRFLNKRSTTTFEEGENEDFWMQI